MKTTKKQDAALKGLERGILDHEEYKYPGVHYVLIQTELQHGLLAVSLILRHETIRIQHTAVISRQGEVALKNRVQTPNAYTPGRSSYQTREPARYVLERGL